MGDLEPCRLVVVEVTHDSEKWLEGFFASWEKSGSRGRVIAVDAGSRDGTLEMLRGRGVEVVECGNVGFGAAANRGAVMANSEWVLLCNPDLEFEGDVAGMIAAVEGRGDVGCVGPRLLNKDGTVQMSVGCFPTIGGMVADQFRRRERRKYFAKEEAGVVEWATGACLMVRRTAWESVGGFDEKFFLYGEEVDFQRRLLEKGWGTYFYPGLRVKHLGAAAGRGRDARLMRYAARGLLRYFAKHGTWGQLFWYRVMAVLAGRLSLGEAFASREKILEKYTGP